MTTPRRNNEVQGTLRAALLDFDVGDDVSAGQKTVAQFLHRWLIDTLEPGARPETHGSSASSCGST